MKKAYNKPEIMFDSFELSQSIAACSFDYKIDEETGEPMVGVDGEFFCYHIYAGLAS